MATRLEDQAGDLRVQVEVANVTLAALRDQVSQAEQELAALLRQQQAAEVELADLERQRDFMPVSGDWPERGRKER
ncbi:Flagellar motor rotation protein MotB [Rhodovastum atsumiense]|uniref:Uncharacterized protein n=1 Tax=Rhodovastum atsumiense TaxID=504468 RepID=A0A5M6IN72_9PROT|nr:hypothetical protein [Rhodovastum atsumiense]KAA5609704.1 hypothetical protein F1189_22695 [Rhodovastum atsumiense]CAH2604472.1 Flagellar motor rotation protein MotB [Rhodovastum atsumiense]